MTLEAGAGGSFGECLLVSGATERYFHGFEAATLETITGQRAIVGSAADRPRLAGA